MEQINIIFFLLASFFGIEDSKIAADKTTVTINPKTKEIVIVQEHIFTFIQTEKDTAIALAQWEKIANWKVNNIPWAKELESFPSKGAIINSVNGELQTHITLTYTNENDLRAMGIWYNKEKNQFSINEIPRDHTTSETGKIEGNYWVFNGNSAFSFTTEPFVDLPTDYKKFKHPITEILK
ncbi:hypothetical protein [Maribacter hydrothermalis]|uniref:Uncharacterized protein n=1 Tax=Maribacter hydrothermalis TaxID=1836467 RepID=A0A1B7Z391_9FLAO|nr:hypothetical protein [Maribacter hydrothermalis]APQ16924.1 hypothetical protein BTR34_06145 [Maribacter hydrothermalis]OBR37185.1 hypothetical protein A9200_05905 [Maribacter hydrothermalis]